MTNQYLSHLPPTEKLAAYHKGNPPPVWYQGRLVSAAEAARLQAQAPRGESLAGLTAHQIAERLTEARTEQNKAPAEPTGRGGYTAFDENGVCMGYVIFDDSIGIA